MHRSSYRRRSRAGSIRGGRSHSSAKKSGRLTHLSLGFPWESSYLAFAAVSAAVVDRTAYGVAAAAVITKEARKSTKFK